MFINITKKTSWFQLGVVVVLTLISFWFIKQAFAEPLVEWKAYNEIRAAEIKAITE